MFFFQPDVIKLAISNFENFGDNFSRTGMCVFDTSQNVNFFIPLRGYLIKKSAYVL